MSEQWPGHFPLYSPPERDAGSVTPPLGPHLQAKRHDMHRICETQIPLSVRRRLLLESSQTQVHTVLRFLLLQVEDRTWEEQWGRTPPKSSLSPPVSLSPSSSLWPRKSVVVCLFLNLPSCSHTEGGLYLFFHYIGIAMWRSEWRLFSLFFNFVQQKVLLKKKKFPYVYHYLMSWTSQSGSKKPPILISKYFTTTAHASGW